MGSIGKVIEEIFYKEVVKDYIFRVVVIEGILRLKIKKFICEY